ncbi:hypothetical protein JW899_02470 [Candidatus Uhrbacteria bacterium]|nr:hypothetical protein [Candidatus Uhrbacteria bacterium]
MKREREPYIGITGFMSLAEVGMALTFHSPFCPRKLMVGVLASGKTLSGTKNKWPGRYPNPAAIAEIFPVSDRTINLIHYATDDKKTLSGQLDELVRLGGPNLDGFQLNVAWPEPAALRGLRGKRVVLQLGKRALEKTKNDPRRTADRLGAYLTDPVITDVLIDASGGRGIPLNIRVAEAHVREIGGRYPELGVGVAGGLSCSNVWQVGLLGELSLRVSIDAEGRLRTADDEMDPAAVQAYLLAAARVFGS